MAQDRPSTEHFKAVVTDRSIEEPWVVAKARPAGRLLDIGSATSRYLRDLAGDCDVYAIDIRPTPRQEGIAVVLGDLMHAPFAPGSFDVITCISTVEHVGLAVYGQGPDAFGDEVALRHMRRLLRPGGRLLLTAPFGRRFVAAWHRVYDTATFRRLTRGYKVLSQEHYKREGEPYVPCQAEDVKGADFDWLNVRSDAVVLAELTPGSGLSHFLARLSLRVRRTWRKLTQRGAFWADPWTGESAGEWLRRKQAAARQSDD